MVDQPTQHLNGLCGMRRVSGQGLAQIGNGLGIGLDRAGMEINHAAWVLEHGEFLLESLTLAAGAVEGDEACVAGRGINDPKSLATLEQAHSASLKGNSQNAGLPLRTAENNLKTP